MIDETTIADLVQREIQSTVTQYVQSVLQKNEWQQTLEQQIVQHVKDRVSAKFQNISDLPDVVREITHSVQQLFDQGQIPSLEKFVSQDQIKQVIDGAIQNLVTTSLENLVNDPNWVDKIQTNIENNVVSRTGALISDIDIGSVVAEQVKVFFEKWKTEFEKSLERTGIKDVATQCELVISDGAVVANSGLACQSLLAEQDITVKNLVVTGTVNTDCESWNELSSAIADKTQTLLGQEWQQQLVSQVLALARDQGIEFDSVTIKGAPLVQGNKLNPEITETSIQHLGNLRTLRVLGKTELADSMTVGDRRVGINTDSPDMALTIWDEEVSVSLGKVSRDRAWIGSTRNQSIDFGTNRKRAMSIESDGLVVIDRIRLNRWRIDFGNSAPNHSGTRGDVVINHDPKPNSPFGWQCLGGFKWQPINLS